MSEKDAKKREQSMFEKNTILINRLDMAKQIIKGLLKLVDPLYKLCEEESKMLEQAEQFIQN